MYEHEHHKKMSTTAIAAMLSTILYYRRFFPYYTYNILAGLDEEGQFLTCRYWIIFSNIGLQSEIYGSCMQLTSTNVKQDNGK